MRSVVGGGSAADIIARALRASTAIIHLVAPKMGVAWAMKAWIGFF